MKLLNHIKLTKINIVYDDDEFTLSHRVKDYLMALLGSSFLLISYIFNGIAYAEIGKQKGLYFIIPIFVITLGYFVITLVQYIESKRLKDKWYSYKDLTSITLNSQEKSYQVTFYLKNRVIKNKTIENDLYFRQFIDLLKSKGVNITGTNPG